MESIVVKDTQAPRKKLMAELNHFMQVVLIIEELHIISTQRTLSPLLLRSGRVIILSKSLEFLHYFLSWLLPFSPFLLFQELRK